MRRTVWFLTITPLVALCIAVLLSAIAHAAVVPTAATAVNAVAVDSAATGNSSSSSPEELTVALQTTITPTTPSITPSIVLPRLTPVVTATVQVSPTTPLSGTAALSTTLSTGQNLTSTVNLSVTRPLTTAITTADETRDDTAILDAEYAGPIEGTIIANRTDANVRFFVEGATYELAPLRSIGLALPRVTAVLNLFNCDALLPETQAGCFWDPYLLDREGFYEVNSGEEASLTLQTAGTPPGNQIWLQNRTGKREQIFYAGETYDLPPSTVQEFTVEETAAEDSPVLFYLRSCLAVSDRVVCEWVPNDAVPGVYYALVETTVSGNVPDSSATTLQLETLFVADGNTATGDEVVTPVAPTQVSCRIDVPALNVRSGPGLQYLIVSKIPSTEQSPATITVIGRDAEAQWFAVDDSVAADGWVTGSSGFVTCDGDTLALPVIEVVDGRLAQTPVPVTPVAPVDTTTSETAPTETDDTPAPVDEATGEDEVVETAPTATVAVQPLADGQSLIVVNNGFDQQVRFTLDQRYRIEPGPSEYDLPPGQSVSLLVYPGAIAFSASSPWNGLSGNQEFFIAEKETRNLWIIFVPDPDGSGRWLLQF